MSPKDATPCDECEKVRVEQELTAGENVKAFERELTKLDATTVTELQKSELESEFALSKLFHEKLAEVATGSVERSRDSAKYIQTAAAAIASLYTGLLALVFSVTDHPLPLRGAFAAFFLGLAVALSAAYLAFITSPPKMKLFAAGASLTERQLNRTGFLIRWVNAAVGNRRWAIRASVLCLAFGVAFIPAAFLSSHRPAPVPAAPTAPSIPGEVASVLTGPALKLFNAQVGSFEGAEKARNEAIEKASEEAKAISSSEESANLITLAAAAICLLIALLGPIAYAKWWDPHEE
jgi:hypothetical protein